MSIPSPIYKDGMTTAARCGLPLLSAPIPGLKNRLLLTERWQMLITSITTWTPLALNTAHPEDSTYILVEETEPQDLGGGNVQWTRKYAQLPPQHNEWETTAYNFIGYFGTWGTSYAAPASAPQPTGRNRQTLPVQSRIQHDYFLVDSSVGTSIGPGSIALPYDSPGSIPNIQSMKFRLVALNSTFWMDIDYLSSHPPFNFGTTPSRTEYEAFVINATKHRWSSGIVSYDWNTDVSGAPVVTIANGTNPGQIAAEESRIDRWLGNIWLRRSRWVLAQ